MIKLTNMQLGVITATRFDYYECHGMCLHMTIKSIYPDGKAFIFSHLIPEAKFLEMLDTIINTPYLAHLNDLIGQVCIIKKINNEESRFVSFFNIN